VTARKVRGVFEIRADPIAVVDECQFRCACRPTRTKKPPAHGVYIRCVHRWPFVASALIVWAMGVPVPWGPQGPLAPGLPDTSSMRISQPDFKTLLTKDPPIVVDVRTMDAFRKGHIPGAVLLPFEGRTSLPPESDDLVARLKSATQPIVTYCACHGETTSTRVAILLQLRGVKHVRVLTGGWDDWVGDHNAIER